MAPKPILLGFIPKRVARRPEWLQNTGVREVCSVSSCVSPAPADYIDRFDWNSSGFYSSADAATAAIPSDSGGFELFAYRIYPWKYDESGEHDFDARAEYDDLPHDPDLKNFHLIGYDVVEKSSTHFFECSPLSCNNYAAQVQVNSFCLLDTIETARQLAVVFGDDEKVGVEPSPYYILEVWRRIGG